MTNLWMVFNYMSWYVDNQLLCYSVPFHSGHSSCYVHVQLWADFSDKLTKMAQALWDMKDKIQQKKGESHSEGVALDLCLFGALVIRAGIRTPPVLFVALSWAFPGHVEVFPLLLLFRLHFIKLGLYLGWVSVSVKIGHDGKDDTHQHQQGGEENVLGPLVKRNTKKCSFGAWYKGWETASPVIGCSEILHCTSGVPYWTQPVLFLSMKRKYSNLQTFISLKINLPKVSKHSMHMHPLTWSFSVAASATISTMMLPTATVNSQPACSTDFMLLGAWIAKSSIPNYK